MNSRERLLTAINGGVPDTIPVTFHFLLDSWTQHALGVDSVEAFRKLGGDCVLYAYGEKQIESDEWIVTQETRADGPYTYRRRIITTPGGQLTDEVKYATQNPLIEQLGTDATSEMLQSWHQTEYLIKEERDLELLIRYLPPMRFDPKPAEDAAKRLGTNREFGIVRGSTSSVVTRAIYEFRGPEQFVMDCYDRPDWVYALVRKMMERSLQSVDGIGKSASDLVEVGGTWATTALISPSIYEEFVLPYDQKIVQNILNQGKPTTYHTCGKCRDLLPFIAQTGTTCSETLTPPAGGGDVDVAEVKQAFGDRLTFIGGFDHKLLLLGTPDEVEAEVARLIDAGGPDGYVLMCTDLWYEAKLENVRAYCQAARRFGKNR